MFKIITKIKKAIKDNRGVSLVIAVTTMTLLLSVSLSISSIVLRQIKINILNNSSKPAFFIADSAMECAFYYDTLFIASSTDPSVNINNEFTTALFGPTMGSESSYAAFLSSYITCGKGAILNANKDVTDPTKILTTFDIDYGNNMCAKIEIARKEVETEITARGYNTSADTSGCILTNADSRRVVERGLTIKY